MPRTLMAWRPAIVITAAAVLTSCSTQPQKKPVEHAPPPVAQPVPPPSTAPNGITVAAVGDIMMGTDYPENVLPDDDGVGFLAGVAPTLSAADIAFGNVEGVLMDGGEAVKRCRPATTHNSTKKNTATSAAARTRAPTSPAAAPSAAPAPPASPSVSTAPTSSVPTPAAAAPPAPPVEEAGPDSAKADVAAAEATTAVASLDATPPVGAADAPTAANPVTAAPEPSAAVSTTFDVELPSIDSLQPVLASVTRLPEIAPPPAPPGSCYVFRSPTRYAGLLRDAGFDVVSLANNHAQDFGDPGRDSTMRTLDAVGIRHSGRDGDIAEWTTQGRRFALVAFAPNVGSHQLNDLERAKQIVTELAARHDIVIVSFHGGGEGEGASRLPFTHEIYQGEDRGDVVEFAHTVIDAGADLVLGHGPHVLRPMELYKDRLIAYSLGNFATYYGISVNGIRGIAAVLIARVADDGRFLDGRIESTNQIRPAGPTLDPARRAVTQLRDLTTEAFPAGRLIIEDDGRIAPR